MNSASASRAFGWRTLNHAILDNEQAYLAGLLEAIQRCVFFLDASAEKLTWPLQADFERDFFTITENVQVEEK